MVETAQRIKNVEEYYFSKKLQEVRSLDTPEFPVINLGIGSPDRAPDEKTIAALQATSEKGTSHGYQSYKGIPALRKGFAEFSNRMYGTSLDPERQILPLMGSKEGIMHISMAFVDAGETVLIPNPGYPTYASVSNLVGAQVDTYTLKEEKNWSIDWEELESKNLSNVKIMWINSPHMPTGSVLSVAEMKRLVDLAKRNNFLLVNDNPYSLVLNDNPQSILSIEGAEEVTLELNSLSKSHNMAGWRVGWLAGKAEYVDAVLRVKSNMDSGMFLGIQEASVEALNHGTEWFEELNKVYAERRTEALRIMDLLQCEYAQDQVGLFVWGKVSKEVENVEAWVDSILYGTKVFITPGFIFGSAGDRFIRISLCATRENLTKARARLEEWMSEALVPVQQKELEE